MSQSGCQYRHGGHCEKPLAFWGLFFDFLMEDIIAMARIFVTGSADGLGKMAAQLMVEAGHAVVLHARNQERATQALAAVPGAQGAVVGDLSSIEATRGIADQINRLGAFDAVIHNAGIGYQERVRGDTVDGLPPLFAVNTLAPYILTALIRRPKRLVYLSSGMHRGGDTSLADLAWKNRRWNGSSAYCDTKLHDVILAFAVARKWPEVFSNSVEPGWVATKMGGPNAPDDLAEGPRTQAWLATSGEPAAQVTGRHFFHMKPRAALAAASDPRVQDLLLKECGRICGMAFPDGAERA
jgi:NAD(P)-dependent dehydrogenase (short-subunit alcohol dehydrogenase family)